MTLAAISGFGLSCLPQAVETAALAIKTRLRGFNAVRVGGLRFYRRDLNRPHQILVGQPGRLSYNQVKSSQLYLTTVEPSGQVTSPLLLILGAAGGVLEAASVSQIPLNVVVLLLVLKATIAAV